MRLITHNMLQCNIRGIENGYPLIIEPDRVEIIPSEANLEMVRNTVHRLNWRALQVAANSLVVPFIDDLTINADGSSVFTEDQLSNEELLRKIHHLLFEIHVLEGSLVCPQSGRKFPIKDGIPNMLLHEDEV